MTLTKDQIRRLGELHKEIASIYLSTTESEEVGTNVEDVKKEEVVAPKGDVVVEDTKEEVVPTEVTESTDEDEDMQDGKDAVNLEGMAYNDLKKLAKELQISAKGSKAELIARIQDAQGITVVDEDEEEETEVDIQEVEDQATPDESVEEDEEVEETETDDTDEEEELPKTLHDEIVSDLAEYTDEELKEILESIDKPTKGKRQTLIALIVQAIEDGELDFGDEEEEEETESEETPNDEVVENDDEVEETDDEIDDEEEIDLEDLLSDLDRDQLKVICRKLDIKVMKKDTEETLADKIMEYEDENSLIDVLIDLGYIDMSEEEDEEEEELEIEDTQEPDFKGSKERIKAMKKVYNETLEDIAQGNIKAKDITKFLKEYHNDTWKGTQDENNMEYARIQAELVDDEGDQVTLEEAYYVGEEIYCCGAKLKDLDDSLYCEVCGTEYE